MLMCAPMGRGPPPQPPGGGWGRRTRGARTMSGHPWTCLGLQSRHTTGVHGQPTAARWCWDRMGLHRVRSDLAARARAAIAARVAIAAVAIAVRALGPAFAIAIVVAVAPLALATATRTASATTHRKRAVPPGRLPLRSATSVGATQSAPARSRPRSPNGPCPYNPSFPPIQSARSQLSS